MPRRVHKYDRMLYHMSVPAHQRRVRKAFYFIERLMQINPEFREKMRQLRRLQAMGKITAKEADIRANQLIMEVIEG